MKRIEYLIGATLITLALAISVQSCKPSAMVMAKTGAQIWGETCIRCHNTPSPATFSDVDWAVAGMHMQLRANLTQDETDKVIEFLQSAN
jgi:nitrate/TMAO reductase-like tetraheme cytochrome c subunit